MRGMLVDVPLRVLRCTARVATITMQSIHFAAPSTHPMEGIAEGPRWWRFGSGFEGGWPRCGRAVRPCWRCLGGPWRWRLGGIWSCRWRRGSRPCFRWGLVLRTVRPRVSPTPIISSWTIAGRALQCMGRDLHLAVVAPPSVKETLPRRWCLCLRPTISTRRGGGGAFLESVCGGSVEARAPEDSAPGRSRQRPDDLDPFPRWVPLAPPPFPLVPLPKPGNRSCLHRRCVRTHPQPKHQPSPQYWWWPHWRQNLRILPFLTLT